MAERYWERRTSRQHSYIDGANGRVIGSLYFRLADMLYEAHAYDRKLGDFADADLACVAVEEGCVLIEAETRQRELERAAKAASQADGGRA